MARIIYSRGFPAGAPLVMIRGGGTKSRKIQEFLKAEGFRYDGSLYAWKTYLNAPEFRTVLLALRNDHGCEISHKKDMNESYILDLDEPELCENCGAPLSSFNECPICD